MHTEVCLLWTCKGWSSFMGCAAYSFVANDHSKESAFLLMCGKDVYIL